MVTIDHRLDLTFAALGDATRRAILARLSIRDATVGELARPFQISRPAISRHLRVLEDAGLVRRTRVGRVNRCALRPRRMSEAAAWIQQYQAFWQGQLDALASFVEDHSNDDGASHSE